MERPATKQPIIYESSAEYKRLRDEFKKELPTLIKQKRADVWALEYHDGTEYFGLSYSSPLESILHTTLTKLSKNQNAEWVSNMIDVLSCAVRSLANSIKYMNVFDEFVECEDCGNDCVHLGFQRKFKEPEICNIMTVNLINGILFDDDGTGNTFMGADNSGQMWKVMQFKCSTCNIYTDRSEMISDEECFACYDKLENTSTPQI